MISLLSRANQAVQQGRLDDAAKAYSKLLSSQPLLSSHAEFNLQLMSSKFEFEPASPIGVAVSGVPFRDERLLSQDVVVVVTGNSFQSMAETAKIFLKRANQKAGAIILLPSAAPGADMPALRNLIGTVRSRHVLVVNEYSVPGRNWLTEARSGLFQSRAPVVRANTGGSKKGGAWESVFGHPSLILSVIDGQLTSSEAPIVDNFIVFDKSFAMVTNPHLESGGGVIHQIANQNDELLSMSFVHDVCVVMPCIDVERGVKTAELLAERAGMSADFVVAVDPVRSGFISTLNAVARQSTGRYVVYLAEDALPGHDWLLKAYLEMRNSHAKLLAFNCGKWYGRVAAFGMVDRNWAYSLYGDQVLFEGYRSHRADNEITAIARSRGEFVFRGDAVLMEDDTTKDFRRHESSSSNFSREDRDLFRQRFSSSFNGLADRSTLRFLKQEYLNVGNYYLSRTETPGG